MSLLGQVMMMVGINPVPDALGRVNKLEVIPLEELGRPRIDVVVNCSGVFRDLFVNQVSHIHPCNAFLISACSSGAAKVFCSDLLEVTVIWCGVSFAAWPDAACYQK